MPQSVGCHCSPKATIHELLLSSGGEEILQESFCRSSGLGLLAVDVLIHDCHWELDLQFAPSGWWGRLILDLPSVECWTRGGRFAGS